MQGNLNGERLKKARIYRELSVSDLAEQSECSRQSIYMYEKEKTKRVDLNTIETLAKALKFPERFLCETDMKAEIGSTYFRALLTTSSKYRESQIQKMEFLADIFVFLQEYLEFPHHAIPDCAGQTPEEAAATLRREWHLGTRPIENIVSLVESNGIIVTKFSVDTNDIDAFSQLVRIGDEDIYLIGYSENKTAASRIHFDIAHELGHICLHGWSEDIEKIDRDEFKKREKEANEFAAAFLLPGESFAKDAAVNPKSIPAYTELKRKWKVSIQAMARRSFSLGLITMEEYQEIIRTLQRRGMRKQEPLDNMLVTASPTLLKTAVIMLLTENVFTPQEFMDELSYNYNLSLYPKEVESLLDLPRGTLNKPKAVYLNNLKLKE
ncbi:MAG: helix-turn-helix domain-containing protein [Gemmiger formicilis]|jgi:Zn-dependent peptidase ImmA (M78 family)/DNA-binding XRE family transcriptional regulator|uniref:helix-turn-helix domain-containing protein n=1 Tax=Gemmiger formicilis TaxID=745368 RepID=UPI0039A35287